MQKKIMRGSSSCLLGFEPARVKPDEASTMQPT